MSAHRFFRLLLVFGLFLSPAAAQNYGGWLDVADCDTVQGWAWDSTQPNTPITVDVYDGATLLATTTAGNFRQDLLNAGIGNGYHGFYYSLQLTAPGVHTISVKIGGTGLNLSGSPKSVACGYQYYLTDSLQTLDPARWTQNGSISATASGLTATSSSGGSWISSTAVPDGSSDYEVKMKLNLAASGGTYAAYLRASPDAMAGPSAQGTYYSVELQNPTFSGNNCSASLVINMRNAGA